MVKKSALDKGRESFDKKVSKTIDRLISEESQFKRTKSRKTKKKK